MGIFLIPLATTEGALVASYHRGAKATKLAGGIRSLCLSEGVQRSPVFQFADLGEVGKFVEWLLKQHITFENIVSSKSRFAKLQDMKPHIEGNRVIVTFDYYPGDAAGQNMVTICSDALCTHILGHTPVTPVRWFLEGNFSGR